MHLRLGDSAGGARLSNDLTAADLVAALDEDLLVIGIGRHPVIGVPDQHEIAVALKLVAGIGDDAALGGAHRGALGHGDVDALVLQAVGLWPIGGNDLAAHGPAEAEARGGLGRRFDGRCFGHGLLLDGRALVLEACLLLRLGGGGGRLLVGERYLVGHRRGLLPGCRRGRHGAGGARNFHALADGEAGIVGKAVQVGDGIGRDAIGAAEGEERFTRGDLVAAARLALGGNRRGKARAPRRGDRSAAAWNPQDLARAHRIGRRQVVVGGKLGDGDAIGAGHRIERHAGGDGDAAAAARGRGLGLGIGGRPVARLVGLGVAVARARLAQIGVGQGLRGNRAVVGRGRGRARGRGRVDRIGVGGVLGEAVEGLGAGRQHQGGGGGNGEADAEHSPAST